MFHVKRVGLCKADTVHSNCSNVPHETFRIKSTLDLLEGINDPVFLFLILRKVKSLIAVPVDILSGPLGVNVFAVLHIEPAVIVTGIVGAMFAGAPVVSCQFQTFSLLPAKMFRGRGRAAKPQILRILRQVIPSMS